MRSSLVWLLSVAAVAGCAKAESEDGGGGGAGGFSMPVEVVTARVDTVVDAITTTGQIEAVQSILLRPDVGGRIVEILFREGSTVAKGEPLFKVDDAELVAQVARAEADRDLAKQALERTRKLVDDNASSQADLELAEANYRSNDAQLQLLQIRLERTLVRAPFRGVVGTRSVSLGDYVTTATEMVSLQTYNPQRAAFKVPERFAERLAAGQEVLFRVASLPGREFRGVVEFVDPVVALPARVITVKARVSNRDRVLRPGMFIEVRLATDVRPSAVIVPEEAIVPLEGLVIVWVVNDEGTVERREVTLGVRTPGFVEVRSGVDGNEQVVVGGQVRLAPGMPVTPIPVDRPPPQQGGGTDAAPDQDAP
ncbi:MAG: efflux RND transporter periplasmic adaptor subunit [Gemmatimonadetes bacterium]|nr:efflux RND transporter periplasmic adaptor subunit [Gemmatimonadota bacterium]